PYRRQLARAVGMFPRRTVIAGIGGVELIGRVVGGIVDEEGVAGQRRTIERKQPPARFRTVGPAEKWRHRIVEPLEPAVDRLELGGTKTEAARSRPTLERPLVFLHAWIEGRIGPGDAQQQHRADAA